MKRSWRSVVKEGKEGAAAREVGWGNETAQEESQMMSVIICERREERKGETGGEDLQKTHEDPSMMVAPLLFHLARFS